jgi:hypothetical protein
MFHELTTPPAGAVETNGRSRLSQAMVDAANWILPFGKDSYGMRRGY